VEARESVHGGWHDASVTSLAITVVGHDRPGIIAQAAEALAGCEMNLEDSSMTLLRGHFAMTLICSGSADHAQVEAAMSPLASDALSVSVREVVAEPDQAPAGETYLVTVHGADRLGIVARLATVIADGGGNITDLTTRLSGDLYVLLAEVDLPAGIDLPAFEADVAREAAALGVDAALRPLERDEL
jgi:glycine cleavage system transcriptional repressor